MFDFIFLFGLIVTHTVAYFIGRGDGESYSNLSEQAQLELEKYKYDRFYEYKRWQESHGCIHEETPVDEEPCDGCTYNPATPWNGIGTDHFEGRQGTDKEG